MPPDVCQYLAYTFSLVKVFTQFHEVASGGRPKIIPFVQPVIDLEDGDCSSLNGERYQY